MLNQIVRVNFFAKIMNYRYQLTMQVIFIKGIE